MAITPDTAADVWARAQLLHGPAELESALDRMAEAIGARLGTLDPLIITVMHGGLITAGKLLPRLKFPLRVDYLHATRYRERTFGGELRWLRRPESPLTGEHVLLVDDILDEGITLAAIARACREAGALEVLSAVLVEKRHDRGNGLTADFVGLQVADRYVFGYGMDYKGYLRNADGIYAVADDSADSS